MTLPRKTCKVHQRACVRGQYGFSLDIFPFLFSRDFFHNCVLLANVSKLSYRSTQTKVSENTHFLRYTNTQKIPQDHSQSTVIYSTNRHHCPLLLYLLTGRKRITFFLMSRGVGTVLI